MTVENQDVSVISNGPCWCNGDTTTCGHYHGSATGGNTPTKFPHSIYGNRSTSRTERKAIFDILVEIRDLLLDSDG